MNDLYEYFEQMSQSNKIGHAFLIGNISYDLNKDIIQKIVSDFFFFKNVELEENPDIYIIKPDGNSISKSQIKSLLNKLNTTSQFSEKKIYIITQAEKLSDSVYNTLLKTIEEPADNVYAFLITSNMNSVGETIKSRCQCIFISSTNSIKCNSLYRDYAYEIINNIEKYGINTCGEFNEVYKKIENRTSLLEIINEIYDIYLNVLYNKVGIKSNVDDDFMSDSNIELICKKILFVNSLIEKSNVNINKDILIDELIYG